MILEWNKWPEKSISSFSSLSVFVLVCCFFPRFSIPKKKLKAKHKILTKSRKDMQSKEEIFVDEKGGKFPVRKLIFPYVFPFHVSRVVYYSTRGKYF